MKGVPVRQDDTRLTDDQIADVLGRLEGWRRDGVLLVKDFEFATWKDVNRFLPYLGKTIAALNHHPDFRFDGGRKLLHVEVTTHSKGGLTQADVDLARALNAWRDRD
ncbi:MAG: 4a-hydroxytetrahydrobiopterin dehydratase [Gemmatimonadota bacterium]